MDNSITDRKEYTSLLKSGIFVMCLLLVIGFSALYSASYDKALRMGLSANYFFRNQVIYGLIGCAGAAVIFFLPLNVYRFFTPLLIFASLALMLMTLFTGLGQTQLGARRWIQLGPVGFQPSELVKISVILYLANYFDRKKSRLGQFVYTVYPAVVVFMFAGLILMQRDFSTMFLFTVVCILLFIAAGTKITYLAYLVALVGIPGLLILVSETYRLKRVIGFLFKDVDPSGINYQINASIEAIMAGGIFGKGFGNGIYKLGRLPEVHSDFIFSSFTEETGLVGALLVTTLFCSLAIIGYKGAIRLKWEHPYLYFLGIGTTSLIVWQAFMNIGVVSGVIPPTGIPLPFFSQGGTSLCVSLGLCGLLCKVLRQSDIMVKASANDSDYVDNVKGTAANNDMKNIIIVNQEVTYE